MLAGDGGVVAVEEEGGGGGEEDIAVGKMLVRRYTACQG